MLLRPSIVPRILCHVIEHLPGVWSIIKKATEEILVKAALVLRPAVGLTHYGYYIHFSPRSRLASLSFLSSPLMRAVTLLFTTLLGIWKSSNVLEFLPIKRCVSLSFSTRSIVSLKPSGSVSHLCHPTVMCASFLICMIDYEWPKQESRFTEKRIKSNISWILSRAWIAHYGYNTRKHTRCLS